VRLNKYIGESGQCSRREADALIEAGRVTVNGTVAVLGLQVGEDDEVRIDGQRVGAARKLERPVYIALNKPVGITCTTDRRIAGNIVDFVGHDERIFMIGRLDKDSEGLILLTNDGDIVNEVLRAAHGHEKEYLVYVDGLVTDAFVQRMAGGVQLSDALTQPCKVRKVGAQQIDIVLTQGLNRQIRRMCEALGHKVLGLRRIRIMHIELGELPRGQWRDLTAEEVAGLAPPPERRVKWQPGVARPIPATAARKPAGGPSVARGGSKRRDPPRSR
jgi:23S rRNA pseudouridine2604 synthase